jgi:hypothetical protein
LSLGHFGFDLLDHPLCVVEILVDPADGGHRHRTEGHTLLCEPTQVVDDLLALIPARVDRGGRDVPHDTPLVAIPCMTSKGRPS